MLRVGLCLHPQSLLGEALGGVLGEPHTPHRALLAGEPGPAESSLSRPEQQRLSVGPQREFSPLLRPGRAPGCHLRSRTAHATPELGCQRGGALCPSRARLLPRGRAGCASARTPVPSRQRPHGAAQGAGFPGPDAAPGLCELSVRSHRAIHLKISKGRAF